MRTLPLVLMLLVPGCVLGPVDYEGKRCDSACPSSLRCVDGQCRAVNTTVWAARFRLEWATPRSMRWAWEPQGDPQGLATYELLLGHDGAPPMTLTVRDLPELGAFYIRRSGGFDVVDGVIVPELEPGTVYTAVLRVRDVAGNVFETRPVVGSTDVARSVRQVVFDEALPRGYRLPSSYAPAAGAGLDGGLAMRFRAGLPDGGFETFENLRFGGLGLPASITSPRDFEGAYLEFFVRGRGMPGSSWCEVWLRLEEGAPGACRDLDACIFTYGGKWVHHPTPAGDTWRRVQLPLRILTRRVEGGELLKMNDLTRRLDELNVAVPYTSASDEVFLDRVVLAW